MKKILALAFSLLAATLAARADLIYYEAFAYTNGNLTNVSSGKWVNFSGNGNKDMFVVNSNLQVSTSSSIIPGAVRQDDDYLTLGTSVNSPFTNAVQKVYASFTVICTNLPNGGGTYMASFYNPKTGTGGGYFGRVQFFTNGSVLPNTWRIGVTANGAFINANDGGYPVDLALNTPYQVVEELDPVTLLAASIWVNPINVNQSGNTATETHYTSSDTIGGCTTAPVNSYSFRQPVLSGDSCFLLITNLSTATSFAEAATNVWGTNAVAPVIVYQPVGVTNFVAASFSLSGVANGQGLGALTYQWQMSATPDNANPTTVFTGSNVLTFWNAQTTDSGYYTLVVTTPYGLSTTSSIAKVQVIAVPGQPSFAVQPSSQSAYPNQPVTFTAMVASPGNVTFTWYSNNVVVTSGQVDAGDISTLQVNNLTADSSATFKVAVTNDVVATGVVSSNAVLTVVNPAVVSISYLRTLVDLATYQPTNTPPSIAYQVTGIVTTLTNITSGDTSSYYLQDGTAGINIFVTGDSNFRPALGDVVTFTGVLCGNNTGLELYADATTGSAYPYTSFMDWSNNLAALPVPMSIPFTILDNPSNANCNLGGRYVQISDVYFGALAGTTLSNNAVNQTVVVTNSTGQSFNLFFPAAYDLDVAGQTLPSYANSVSGVLYSANFIVTNTIVVSRFSDINTDAPLPISLKVSSSGGTLTFNWSDATFRLQSAPAVAGPYTTITGAGPGFITNGLSTPTLFFRLYHP